MNGQSTIPSVEECFRRRDDELMEQMRRRGERQEGHQRLSETLQVSDDKIVSAIENLGFDSSTAMLLEIVPMVDVAWSDGVVSDAERDAILETARADGIQVDTPADRLLAIWLAQIPETLFFVGTLQVLRDFFRLLPPDRAESRRDLLLDRCRKIASVSGGFFGINNPISRIERARLNEITSVLRESKA